jgi:Fe-S-cluster-containing dehydrogenase component
MSDTCTPSKVFLVPGEGIVQSQPDECVGCYILVDDFTVC